MAVTQADIDALNKAIAAGTRSVTIGGQTVVMNTTQSLIEARNDLQAQLNAQNAQTATTRPSKQTRLVYGGRGY